MATFFHPVTNLPLGDPEVVPLERRSLPSPALLAAAASTLILSASGWRKVFAAPDVKAGRAAWAAPSAATTGTQPAATNGTQPAATTKGPQPGGEDGAVEMPFPDDESLSTSVAPADLVIAATMALVFGEYCIAKGERRDGRGGTILLGTDTRPTGPALADIMARVFISLGLEVHYLSVVAAPEIMAYSRLASSPEAEAGEKATGFCYISASHNPPAHNGVKFGKGGGVLSGAEIAPLIADFRKRIADPDTVRRVFALVDEAEPSAIAKVFGACKDWKRRAFSAYTLFARQIVTGKEGLEAQEALLDEMEMGGVDRPLGVLADFNGSARCLSIDQNFLDGLGLRHIAMNDSPGIFAHRIVPEGESLEPARERLVEAGRADAAFEIGYVPDCDGDRGNLVWRDPSSGRASQMGAQEVFAIAVLAELALLDRDGVIADAAVAVNDATSLRIEAIARSFGAEVHRAETGEANVVTLAARLRAEGKTVRILGEGSNGGNITHPSEVRDPLATIGAVLKLLLLRGPGPERESLFHIWLRRSGRLDLWKPDFGMADIIASLPPFATTSVFEPFAALRIAERDHSKLKARYRDLFLENWPAKKSQLLHRWGIAGWRAFATRGAGELEIGDDFAASGQGGLRILLHDEAGAAKGFLWMRGSGTEPVFRVMADIEGGRKADEDWLREWHTAMVQAADATA